MINKSVAVFLLAVLSVHAMGAQAGHSLNGRQLRQLTSPITGLKDLVNALQGLQHFLTGSAAPSKSGARKLLESPPKTLRASAASHVHTV